jgi:hypothetical protein
VATPRLVVENIYVNVMIVGFHLDDWLLPQLVVCCVEMLEMREGTYTVGGDVIVAPWGAVVSS